MTRCSVVKGELGFTRISSRDLIDMRIHGVSLDYARNAKARDAGVTVRELVNMRIHGEW